MSDNKPRVIGKRQSVDAMESDSRDSPVAKKPKTEGKPQQQASEAPSGNEALGTTTMEQQVGGSSPETPVLSLHKLSNSKEVVLFFEKIWHVELELEGDIGPRHRTLEILRDSGITGDDLFSFDTKQELIDNLKGCGISHFPAVPMANQVFLQKGSQMLEWLDGDTPKEPIFGIHLFNFHTKEDLVKVLEGKGYPNADPIAEIVFEMKGNQMLEWLDGDTPKEPIFGIHLFNFHTKEDLIMVLEGKGYPNADPIAEIVFEMKGNQMLEWLDGDTPKEPIFGIHLFNFHTKETLIMVLEGKGYPNAHPIGEKVFEMKEKISEQQKSEVKTGALKKIRDAVRDFHYTGERKAFKLKAQWAFKHSYGLEEAVKLAMVSINHNIEKFGRKEKGRLGDNERFLHEMATLVSSGGGKTHFLDALRAHLVRWAERDPLAPSNSVSPSTALDPGDAPSGNPPTDSSSSGDSPERRPLVGDADSKAWYLPIEISFNSDTPFDLEEVINPFISRIAFEMLYLRTNHKEHFGSSAAPRLPEIKKEFADVTIGELFDSLARAARECRRHVVFLVDEVGLLVQREGFSELLKDFKRNARTHGFSMVWTTFESSLYEDDGQPFKRADFTPSGSPLVWIPLHWFSSSTMGMVAEDKNLKEAAECPPYRFVLSLLSGHQRSIEIFRSFLKKQSAIRPTASVKGILDGVEEDMFKYWSRCGPQAKGRSCYKAEEFVRILKAFAFNEMLDFSERFWQLLIERGVLLNSLKGSGEDFPQFHALWLRVLISRARLSPRPGELPLRMDQLPGNYPRVECLKLLHRLAIGFFDELPTVHSSWESLEQVHIYFECLRHTLLAWKQDHSTVKDYYGSLPQVRKPSSVFLTKPEKKDNTKVATETMHEAPRKRNKKGAASRVTYLDMGRDFRFAPHHTPLSGIPKKLDSEEDLWNFFAARKGACLAPENQKGFDSALWTMKVDEHGNQEHPILFLYENKFSSTDSADPKLETSELSKKVSHVRDVIAEYNASNVGATLRESDVILVFVALRRIRRAHNPIKMSDFGGTVLALQRDFLVDHFYRSMMPFFEISSTLLAKYPANPPPTSGGDPTPSASPAGPPTTTPTPPGDG